MQPMRLACAAALTVAALALPASVAAQRRPAMPTVNITLASHYYQPNPIYLAGGVPVRLIFTNRSGKRHNFKAPAFFRSARMNRGSAPGGVLELHRGRGTVIVLVPARGRYRVHCSEPFHTMLGMTGQIIVS